MKYASIFFLHILFVLGLTQAALGQSTAVTDRINEDADRAPLPRIEKAANKAMREGDHYSAMRYYRRLLHFDSTNVPVLRNYVEVAMRFSTLDSAAWACERLIALNELGSDALPILRLAEIKYRKREFGEAQLIYNRLLTEKPSGVGEAAFAAAQRGLEACTWAEGVADNTEFETLPRAVRELNSTNPEHSEYSPYPLGDKVYFSSYRFPYEKDPHNPERRVVQVIEAVPGPADTMVLRKADEFNLPVNRDQQHTAHVTFNTDRTAMYCSVCKFVNSTDLQCALYVRKREGNGWGKAVRLPNSVNMPDFTTTEPSVGRAPDTNADVLYFVSDRPNGEGGRDIWYSNIMADSFSRPINAGKSINTVGDDVTPFYHSNSGTLYFSTDGRRTLGGLDVYKATGQRSSWSAPEHMGAQVNSGYNDAFFSLTDDYRTAYLVSNRDTTDHNSVYLPPIRRDTSSYKADEACCYDIYRATLWKPKALVQICDQTTQKPLYYSNVRLFEIKPDGSATEMFNKDLGQEAERKMELMPGKKYRIIATRDRYTTETLDFETPRTLWKEPIVKRLCLKPGKVKLIVHVLDKESKKAINGATMRFRNYGAVKPGGTQPFERDTVNPTGCTYRYELDFDHHYRVSASKAGYTSASTDTISTLFSNTTDTTLERTVYLTHGVNFRGWALNKLTRDTLYGVTFTLVELPAVPGKGKKFVNPLGVSTDTATLSFEKRYMFRASKPDFTSDSARVTTVNLPPKDFQEVTAELLLLPAKIRDYLPISLYFDNDEPDKNTTSDTTKREYQPTYVEYYNRKKEFIKMFTTPLYGADKQEASDSIDIFFERDVKQNGWNRLFSFSEALYTMMERGDHIVLTLRGFASPLAKSDYNLHLTSRRVASVHNHFNNFDGKIYRKFVANGQLEIKLAPMGETNVGSDDFKDKRRSVYSVEASRQRRLEIIGVEVNPDKKDARKVQKK